MNRFSHRVKELRKNKGLRQKDLAISLGLAQTTIANYEQGTRFPDEDILKKISSYFEVSTDYLLGITNTMSNDNYSNNEYLEISKAEKHELLSIIKEKYISLILNGDSHIASKIIFEAVNKGVTIQEIFIEIFEYNLKLIGTMWEKSEIDIFQEHYFTICTQQIMDQLSSCFSYVPKNEHSIVLLTVGGELHNMGIKIVASFLEMEGYKTYFLGSNLPTQDIIKAIKSYKAEVLALSTTMSYNIDSLVNLIQAVKNEKSINNLKIIVGGSAFNLDEELWRQVGAEGYSRNAKEVVSLVNSFFV